MQDHGASFAGGKKMKLRKTSLGDSQPQRRNKRSLSSSSNSCRPENRKASFYDSRPQKMRISLHSVDDCQRQRRKLSLPSVNRCQQRGRKLSLPSVNRCQPRGRMLSRSSVDDCQPQGQKLPLPSVDHCQSQGWNISLPSVEHCQLWGQELSLPFVNDYQQKKKTTLSSLDDHQGNFLPSHEYATQRGKTFPSSFINIPLSRRRNLPYHSSCQPQTCKMSLPALDDCPTQKMTSIDGHPPRKVRKSLNDYLLRRRKILKRQKKSKTMAVLTTENDVASSIASCPKTYKGPGTEENKNTEPVAANNLHFGSGERFAQNLQYQEDDESQSYLKKKTTDFQKVFINSFSPDTKKTKQKPSEKKKSQKPSHRKSTASKAKKKHMKQKRVLEALEQALVSEGNIYKHKKKKTVEGEFGVMSEMPPGPSSFIYDSDENIDSYFEVVSDISPAPPSKHDEDIDGQIGMVSEMSPASSCHDDNLNKETESLLELMSEMSSTPLPCHDKHECELGLMSEMSPILQTCHEAKFTETEMQKEKTTSGKKGEKLMRKSNRNKQDQNSDVEGRGQNGWEQSLRQQPTAVRKFQATFSPDPLKKNVMSSVPKQSKKTAVIESVKQDQPPMQLDTADNDLDQFSVGVLVWGKIKGYPYWPAQVVSHIQCNRPPASPSVCWVKWFGDAKYSLVKVQDLASFGPFQAHYQASHSKKSTLYQKAVFQVLQVCATRAKVEFPSEFSQRPLSKDESFAEQQTLHSALINWAIEGFQPNGVEGLAPSAEERQTPEVISPAPIPTATETTKNNPKAIGREGRIEEVKVGNMKLEDMCIACGSLQVICCHPFFVGGLCEICRVEFLETAYLFDNDGYQSYCCVCCAGNEVLLCGNSGCYRSICFHCVKLLDNSKAVKQAIQEDPWICYMCRPNIKKRLLFRREDWPEQLVQIFKNDHVQDFDAFKSYTPPSLKDRCPIKVLALFDGIGTGLLALKELGFKVECYLASEVNEEAIKVATVRHAESIVQVGDIKNITKKQIEEWGPFDLVMGGSPCNDLSIVNPARKGLFEGTGRLFFEFHRILSYAKPIEGDKRPFFWFLENVCFMGHSDKMDISRFLECNPVVVDAKDLTPAHRARYFWGNLPGMDRPNMATDNHNLSLQECLEPNCNRTAQFKKIRTITTKSNSLKQCKEKVLPVLMNGKEDGLWCTEMERLFGFPEHYTDVNNMGRVARQRLLGRAWSVPVIKHLLAPLKDFYVCETR